MDCPNCGTQTTMDICPGCGQDIDELIAEQGADELFDLKDELEDTIRERDRLREVIKRAESELVLANNEAAIRAHTCLPYIR